ncbi:MAG: hypothetical protein PHE67_00385 [Campylobacterales bacterium]|nr:hypothetical protein [Campylobacterales bacterium]
MTQTFQNFQTSQNSRQSLSGLINSNDMAFVRQILILHHRSITRLPFNEGHPNTFNLLAINHMYRFDGLNKILCFVNEPFDYHFVSCKPYISNEYVEQDVFFDVVIGRLLLTMLNWNMEQVFISFDADKREIILSQDASGYMTNNEEQNSDTKEKWIMSKNIYDVTDKYFHTDIYGHRVPVFENEYLIAKILESLDIRMDFVFEGMSNKIVLKLN